MSFSVSTIKSVKITVTSILRKVNCNTPHATLREIKVKASFTLINLNWIGFARPMPEKFIMRFLSKLLLEPQLLVFVVLPDLEILQDLNPLYLSSRNRLFEQVFYLNKGIRADWDVVRHKVDSIDVL